MVYACGRQHRIPPPPLPAKPLLCGEHSALDFSGCACTNHSQPAARYCGRRTPLNRQWSSPGDPAQANGGHHGFGPSTHRAELCQCRVSEAVGDMQEIRAQYTPEPPRCLETTEFSETNQVQVRPQKPTPIAGDTHLLASSALLRPPSSCHSNPHLCVLRGAAPVHRMPHVGCTHWSRCVTVGDRPDG